MPRLLVLAPIALLAACKAPPGPPEPQPSASAAALAPTAASASAARGASSAPPPSPAGPTAAASADPDAPPACQKGPSHYGGWTPSASEVAALLPALRDADCGEPAWRRRALESCVKEQGQSSVMVRFEAVSQPDQRPFECSLGITGAEWKGRRFLVVHDTYFQVPTAWGYTNVYELTPRGPVLFLDGVEKHSPLCQGSSPSATAARPPGWSTFPKDLQKVFCMP